MMTPNNSPSNKLVVILAAVVAIAGLVWWLARSPSGVALTVLGENTSTLQALAATKSDFERREGASINCAMDTFEVLQQKANQDLSMGTGLYDIILNVNFSLSSYVRNGWVLTRHDILSLAPDKNLWAFESDLFPNIWKETGYYPLRPNAEPEAVGYPFAANTMLLVYDKQLFSDPAQRASYQKKFGRELAPPSTWDEFRKIAEFFTQPDINRHGVVLQGANGGWLYYEWCNFAYSMGGGVLKKKYGWEGDLSTPVIIDSPETLAATEFYLSLKPFNAGDFFSTGQNEQGKLLKDRKGAMAIVWSDVLYDLIRDNKDVFGFAPIPGTKSMIGGGIFYINKKSRYPKVAAEYIANVLSKEQQVKLIQLGLCSPLRSAYESPEVKGIPYAAALKTSLDRAVYMCEAGPDADVILDIVTQTIQRIWKGENSATDCLRKANVDLRAKRKEIFESLKTP